MTTTGYAQRARRFLERGGEISEKSQIDGNGELRPDTPPQCEIREISEISPYPPLDASIVASEAERRPLEEIEARLTRLVARAADPDATPLDRQLVADWTAIRRAKVAGADARPPAA